MPTEKGNDMANSCSSFTFDKLLRNIMRDFMLEPIINKVSIERRAYWIEEISRISGRFGDDIARIDSELSAEIERDGHQALADHLRLCGSIPEVYKHDSSEEKLYSKYTDTILAVAFREIGLKAIVLKERADAADVEAVTETYSLVADAKAFRLSRTAKNAKDFKIEAMHGWKRGKPHAIVVCPIYQLPTRSSQIYQQAIARDVCVFSYAHLAVLTAFANHVGRRDATVLLLQILKCAESMNPGKDAVSYWTNLNRTMLQSHKKIAALWQIEKAATLESIKFSKNEALTFLSQERERIMRMSHDEAICSLIENKNLEGKSNTIRNVSDNGILSIN